MGSNPIKDDVNISMGTCIVYVIYKLSPQSLSIFKEEKYLLYIIYYYQVLTLFFFLNLYLLYTLYI